MNPLKRLVSSILDLIGYKTTSATSAIEGDGKIYTPVGFNPDGTQHLVEVPHKGDHAMPEEISAAVLDDLGQDPDRRYLINRTGNV